MAISSSLLGSFLRNLLIDNLIEDIYQQKKKKEEDKLIEDNGVRSSLGDAQKLLSTRRACFSLHSFFNI